MKSVSVLNIVLRGANHTQSQKLPPSDGMQESVGQLVNAYRRARPLCSNATAGQVVLVAKSRVSTAQGAGQ